MNDIKYWLAINKISEIGSIKFNRILSTFKNLETAWQANLPDLMSAGLSEKEASDIIIKRSAINPDEVEEELYRAGINSITITDSKYPKNLKEIYAAPPVLYYRGDLSCLDHKCLAVVGSRKHTAYGASAVKKIIPPLVSSGLTIVSGLALGIDALAHQATLDSNGLTVAVLGSDLSWKNIGPKTNFKLAENILENGGCLLSDYPLGIAANKATFPQRNRIISGLSQGVLVVEASENSGSLITASFALEQNRDIFAIPDSIFSPYSEGCNRLIKKGAKPVMTENDILDELNWQLTLKLDKKSVQLDLTEEEQSIISFISTEPLTLDKLAEVTHTKISSLSSLLMILELKGAVKGVGGGKYMKNF